MFSTCANPDCATPFDYHRGEFFRFHNDHMNDAPDTKSHSVQHFWLCECCCEKYTLHYEKRRGVLISIRSEAVRPRETARVIAAA